MKLNMAKYVAVGTACAVLGGGGIATAATTGLLDGHNIKTGSIPTNRLNPLAQRAIDRALHHNLGPAGPKGAKGDTGAKGATGAAGPQGPAGAKGADGSAGPAGPAGPKGDTGAAGVAGPAGDSYLTGAYYSVAYYDVGDTNGGAVATVACKATTDTAISGGVQTLGVGSNGLQNNVPVSSSFPGRMNWTTNAPQPNRLDGWIIQFGGNSSSTDLGSPKTEKVWALCVPGLNVPADQTYTQSS